MLTLESKLKKKQWRYKAVCSLWMKCDSHITFAIYVLLWYTQDIYRLFVFLCWRDLKFFYQNTAKELNRKNKKDWDTIRSKEIEYPTEMKSKCHFQAILMNRLSKHVHLNYCECVYVSHNALTDSVHGLVLTMVVAEEAVAVVALDSIIVAFVAFYVQWLYFRRQRH